MNWSDAVGREVVDTSTAETIGHLDAVVVDPASSSITGLVVADKVAAWSETGGIGADAVTITSSDLLRDPEPGAEATAVGGGADLISKPVYTEDGYVLGDLTDIEFDPKTGVIGRLLLDDDHFAGTRLIGVGSFAVVISSPDLASNGGDLSSLTKTELYDRAKAQDVDGRSNMSKDELIAALG